MQLILKDTDSIRPIVMCCNYQARQLEAASMLQCLIAGLSSPLQYDERRYCEHDFQTLFAPCCKQCGKSPCTLSSSYRIKSKILNRFTLSDIVIYFVSH